MAGGKRKFKRKSFRRKGTSRRFKRSKRKSFRSLPSITKNRTLGGFPERYFTRLRVTGSGAFPAAAQQYLTFKGNSLGINSGPSVNGGAFSAGVASGMSFLICNPADNPLTAPYTLYRVWGSSIKLRFTNISTGPAAVDYFLFPSIKSGINIGSSSINVIGEQPLVKSKSSVGNNTTKPIMFKRFMSVRKAFGFKYRSAVEGNGNFSGTYNTDPVATWFWNIYAFGDGATNITGRYEYEVTHYVEFYQRSNLIPSANPT